MMLKTKQNKTDFNLWFSHYSDGKGGELPREPQHHGLGVLFAVAQS